MDENGCLTIPRPGFDSQPRLSTRRLLDFSSHNRALDFFRKSCTYKLDRNERTNDITCFVRNVAPFGLEQQSVVCPSCPALEPTFSLVQFPPGL